MLDYHVHTAFSCDSQTPPEEYLVAAERIGVNEICFTDHCDPQFCIVGVESDETDFEAREKYLDALSLSYSGKTRFKRGVEVGLLPKPGVYEELRRVIAQVKPDFVLASIHILGEATDPYSPDFFASRTSREGYVEYLTRVLECIQAFADFDSLGHIFFPARCNKHDDRDFRLSYAPDLIDAIFKRLIENGQAIEINTWDFRTAQDRANYAAVYRRFAQLGGEFCTIGTDAHDMRRFGFMLSEGYELARAAGIKYVAGFDGRKPVLYNL